MEWQTLFLLAKSSRGEYITLQQNYKFDRPVSFSKSSIARSGSCFLRWRSDAYLLLLPFLQTCRGKSVLGNIKVTDHFTYRLPHTPPGTLPSSSFSSSSLLLDRKKDTPGFQNLLFKMLQRQLCLSNYTLVPLWPKGYIKINKLHYKLPQIFL